MRTGLAHSAIPGLTQDRGSPKPKFPQIKTRRRIEMLLLLQSATRLLSAGSVMHTCACRSSASSAQHPQRGSNGIVQRFLLTSPGQRDVALASAGLLPAVGRKGLRRQHPWEQPKASALLRITVHIEPARQQAAGTMLKLALPSSTAVLSSGIRCLSYYLPNIVPTKLN